jgi:hypothetical protein
LIEERAAKVDTYADLPQGIHGRTSLFYDRAPVVKITESILQNAQRSSRPNNHLPRIWSRLVARTTLVRGRREEEQKLWTSSGLELQLRKHH